MICVRALTVGCCALLLGACASSPSTRMTTASAPTEADAARAIRDVLRGDWNARYFGARVDLNGDGREEFVALVAAPMICGTGGCPVFVLTPQDAGYRVVSRLSVVQPPVRVSSRSSNGWRNLIVGIGGGGLPAGNAELRFDGTGYPLNPTVPPAERIDDLSGTEVLIPEFANYRDGKPLATAQSR
jgi:hypothetical protein